MLLLVSGRHVGTHTDGHQHGVSIQISINLRKKIFRICRIRKIAVTRILASLSTLTFFHFPDSGLYLLTGFDFWFWFILNCVTLKTSNNCMFHESLKINLLALLTVSMTRLQFSRISAGRLLFWLLICSPGDGDVIGTLAGQLGWITWRFYRQQAFFWQAWRHWSGIYVIGQHKTTTVRVTWLMTYSSDGQHISAALELDLFWFETTEIQLGLNFTVDRFVFHVFCAPDYERCHLG